MIQIGYRKYTLSVVLKKFVRGTIYMKIAGSICIGLRLKKSNRIVISSHTVSGNAQAYANWLAENHPELDIIFAIDDPDLYKIIQRNKAEYPKTINYICLQHIYGAFVSARAQVICTTHGPFFFEKWTHYKNRPIFIEFWHGVGFKGAIKHSLEELAYYDKICVSSEYFKKLHQDMGFAADKLAITGYARTDALTEKITEEKRAAILDKYDLPNTTKQLILFAPTWNKDQNSNVLFMDSTPDELVKTMESLTKKTGATFVFRPHLNTDIEPPKGSQNVFVRSSKDYPDTEDLLLITDILITDWSSIFTDYMAANRPMIFMDSQPDFDFSALQPSDRAGMIVSKTQELSAAISQALDSPAVFTKGYESIYTSVVEKAWGTSLDGHSSERYYKVMKELIRVK